MKTEDETERRDAVVAGVLGLESMDEGDGDIFWLIPYPGGPEDSCYAVTHCSEDFNALHAAMANLEDSFIERGTIQFERYGNTWSVLYPEREDEYSVEFNSAPQSEAFAMAKCIEAALCQNKNVCPHGKGLADYCEPCGRIHGGG